MKRITLGIRYGHVWNMQVIQRAALALGSVVAFVAASGAGTQWF